MAGGTRLYLDGELLAADEQTAAAGSLVVLDGLNLAWGRSDTYAQPEPSTLTATLRIEENSEAARAAVEAIRPGRTLVCHTDATPRRDARDNILDPSLLERRWLHTAGRGITFVPIESLTVTVADLDSMVGQVLPGQTWTAKARFSSYRGVSAEISIHPLVSTGQPVSIGKLDERVTLARETFTLLGSDAKHYNWTRSLRWTAPADGAPPYIGMKITLINAAAPTWKSQHSWGELGARRWAGYTSTSVDSVVLSADRSTVNTREIFRGRIASATGKETARGVLEIPIAAADVGRDLANTPVGDTPWPVQKPEDRIRRILELATGKPVTVNYLAYSWTNFENWRLYPRDADNTLAAQLLTEVTDSLGAVLWVYETPTGEIAARLDRPAMRDESTWSGDRRPTLEIPAGHIVAHDLEIRRDPSNSVSIVRLSHFEYEGDNRVQKTQVFRDEARLAEIGPRSTSVTVHLTGGSLTRRAVGKEILARSPSTGWQLDGLTYDTRVTGHTATLLELLEPGRREGRRVSVTGIKARWPFAPKYTGFLEGARAEFRHGHWRVALTVLPPTPVPKETTNSR